MTEGEREIERERRRNREGERDKTMFGTHFWKTKKWHLSCTANVPKTQKWHLSCATNVSF